MLPTGLSPPQRYQLHLMPLSDAEQRRYSLKLWELDDGTETLSCPDSSIFSAHGLHSAMFTCWGFAQYIGFFFKSIFFVSSKAMTGFLYF